MYKAAFRNKNGTSPAPLAPRPKAAASGLAKKMLPMPPTSSMTSTESRVHAANMLRPVEPAGGSW